MKLQVLFAGLFGALSHVSARSIEKGEKLPGNTNFKTEPGIALVDFNISISVDDKSLLAPGLIFISNIKGLQIFDQYGNLVWYHLPPEPFLGQDFRPCDYLGDEGVHLCWHETSDVGRRNTADSRNVVYDSNYAQVGYNYSAGIDGITPNLHTFHMLPGGKSFLQPVYVPKQRDLSEYAGEQDGMIWDGCFQEIDTFTAKPIFEWCATDYTDVWETTIFFTTEDKESPPGQTNVTSSKAGRGNRDFPFDFIHVNAITKNEENNYLVSARHFDQILKIAGPNNVAGIKPGTVLWRLGGFRNEFDMQKFDFSKQHAVQYVSTGPEETVISLLDNAWEGMVDSSADYSSGKIIKINNRTMEAVLLNEYPHPSLQLTASQGDMQILPNDNIFMGWGKLPHFSEYNHEGDVLYHASFFTEDYNSRAYRAFKAPWSGHPTTAPKLLAYAMDCQRSSQLVAYVSWNGDTEVHKWQFYVSKGANGPWISAGDALREGFETQHVLSKAGWLSPFMPYVRADGIDSKGTALSRVVTKTWVPPKDLKCHRNGCYVNRHFQYLPELNGAGRCQGEANPVLSVLALIVFLCLVEGANYSNRTLSLLFLENFYHERFRAYVGIDSPIVMEDIEDGQDQKDLADAG